MTTKYYAATVKMGHVGQGKFIIKTIAIKAESRKEAAYKARWTPRVKHHNKHAVIDVKEIDLEAYLLLNLETSLDPYFHCENIQDQREMCGDIKDEIQELYSEIDYEKRREKRKERILFQQKKNKCFYRGEKYFERTYSAAC